MQRIKEYILFLLGKKKSTEEQEENTPDMPWVPWMSETFEEKNNRDSRSKSKEELPTQDEDTYIPHDMEFWESEWEPSRFAVVYPFLRGKYATWKLSTSYHQQTYGLKNVNCNH